MRYACLVYFDPQKVFNQSPESEAVLAGNGAYDAELQASGHYVAAEALQLPESAMTVQVRDGKMSATDGPFMETKEILGGFYVLDVPDLDAALSWAQRAPNTSYGSVEVRPVMVFG